MDIIRGTQSSLFKIRTLIHRKRTLTEVFYVNTNEHTKATANLLHSLLHSGYNFGHLHKQAIQGQFVIGIALDRPSCFRNVAQDL